MGCSPDTSLSILGIMRSHWDVASAKGAQVREYALGDVKCALAPRVISRRGRQPITTYESRWGCFLRSRCLARHRPAQLRSPGASILSLSRAAFARPASRLRGGVGLLNRAQPQFFNFRHFGNRDVLAIPCLDSLCWSALCASSGGPGRMCGGKKKRPIELDRVQSAPKTNHFEAGFQ